jgi:hypothetical protein
VTLSFLTHCAGSRVIKEDEKARLRERINEYWQYKIKGDVEKAYQCEVPAFREKVSILQYVNRFKLFKFVETEVQEIEGNGREADSISKVTYRVLLKPMMDRKLTKFENEKWTKIKGTWYHVPGDFEKENDTEKKSLLERR